MVLRLAYMSWTFMWSVTKTIKNPAIFSGIHNFQSLAVNFLKMDGFRKYPYLPQGWFSCSYLPIPPPPPPPGISSFASYFPLKSLTFEDPMTIFGVGMYIFWNCTILCIVTWCKTTLHVHVHVYTKSANCISLITVVVINFLHCRY